MQACADLRLNTSGCLFWIFRESDSHCWVKASRNRIEGTYWGYISGNKQCGGKQKNCECFLLLFMSCLSARITLWRCSINVIFFVFVFVLLLVRLCIFVTLIKCLNVNVSLLMFFWPFMIPTQYYLMVLILRQFQAIYHHITINVAPPKCGTKMFLTCCFLMFIHRECGIRTCNCHPIIHIR